jgi:hypothetical protein
MAVDTLFASQQVAPRQQIAGAIRQAAQVTGTSFDYLVTTAKIESDFNPRAAASTSSARGLFQFIDQTWLGTVKEAGAALGYGNYADAITRTASGMYKVADPAMRDAILKLRHDPEISAAMAGVLTRSNGIKLQRAIGRQPSDAELYIAHFMGVGAAAKLVSNAENHPRASGAALFPAAAAANRSIFYQRNGAPRSVAEVYSDLTSRYAAAANAPATRTTLAMAAGGKAATGKHAPDNAAYLASFPQAQGATVASSNAAAQAPQPTFRSLFQAGARAEPVSPVVQDLWGNAMARPATESVVAARWPDVAPPSPFDLFSDRFGRFSS